MLRQSGVVTARPRVPGASPPESGPGEALQLSGGGSTPLDGLMRAGMDAAIKLRRAGLEPGRIARLTVLVGDVTGLVPADGDLGEGDQVALLDPRSLLLGIARCQPVRRRRQPPAVDDGRRAGRARGAGPGRPRADRSRSSTARASRTRRTCCAAPSCSPRRRWPPARPPRPRRRPRRRRAAAGARLAAPRRCGSSPAPGPSPRRSPPRPRPGSAARRAPPAAAQAAAPAAAQPPASTGAGAARHGRDRRPRRTTTPGIGGLFADAEPDRGRPSRPPRTSVFRRHRSAAAHAVFAGAAAGAGARAPPVRLLEPIRPTRRPSAGGRRRGAGSRPAAPLCSSRARSWSSPLLGVGGWLLLGGRTATAAAATPAARRPRRRRAGTGGGRRPGGRRRRLHRRGRGHGRHLRRPRLRRHVADFFAGTDCTGLSRALYSTESTARRSSSRSPGCGCPTRRRPATCSRSPTATAAATSTTCCARASATRAAPRSSRARSTPAPLSGPTVTIVETAWVDADAEGRVRRDRPGGRRGARSRGAALPGEPDRSARGCRAQAVAAAQAMSASRAAIAGRPSRPALCGVELISPKTACARARQVAASAPGCSRASTATHTST